MTQTQTKRPIAPSSLRAHWQEGQIIVSWDFANFDQLPVVIEKSSDHGETFARIGERPSHQPPHAMQGGHFHDKAPAESGATYIYRIAAMVDGALSEWVSTTFKMPGFPPTMIHTPRTLQISSADAKTLNLRWICERGVGEFAATHFVVERSTGSSAGFVMIAKLPLFGDDSGEVEKHFQDHQTAERGVAFKYRVCAETPSGNSPYSVAQFTRELMK